MAKSDRPLRIIAFGAHPDDCELAAGGVAAKWAARGHEVKFVSMTNGDIGHFEMAGAPLARRRTAEVEECADILGIETQVMDIHDGELMPTLENRKKMARLIRDWQADIVMAHRPNDYHADHRSVGTLAIDVAVLAIAPGFVPDTEPTEENPVFLYFEDQFTKPNPFQADIVVSIDDVAETKWKCIEAMPSQFSDKESWMANYLSDVPEDQEGRERRIMNFLQGRYEMIADKYRDRLVELYGEEYAQGVTYAEAFELSEYGRQPSMEELVEMFPIG